MAGHAAARGEDALRRVHAVDVLGLVSTRTRITFLPCALSVFGFFRREDDLARGGAGRGGQAGREQVAGGLGIDGRVEELVEGRRIDALHRLVARDQAFVGHVDGDLQRRLAGAFAGARLQHPELAALDGELEILHVAIVALEHLADRARTRRRPRHRRLQRGLVGSGGNARGLGQLLRRADAGDDVLALGVDRYSP